MNNSKAREHYLSLTGKRRWERWMAYMAMPRWEIVPHLDPKERQPDMNRWMTPEEVTKWQLQPSGQTLAVDIPVVLYD